MASVKVIIGADNTQFIEKMNQVESKLGQVAQKGRAIGGGQGIGAGALQAAYVLDDLQYGMKGVLNNIPGLVMGLGGGMGLAGAISIAVLAGSKLYDWMNKTEDKTKALEEAKKKLTEQTAAFKDSLDRENAALDTNISRIKSVYDAEEKLRNARGELDKSGKISSDQAKIDASNKVKSNLNNLNENAVQREGLISLIDKRNEEISTLEHALELDKERVVTNKKLQEDLARAQGQVTASVGSSRAGIGPSVADIGALSRAQSAVTNMMPSMNENEIEATKAKIEALKRDVDGNKSDLEKARQQRGPLEASLTASLQTGGLSIAEAQRKERDEGVKAFFGPRIEQLQEMQKAFPKGNFGPATAALNTMQDAALKESNNLLKQAVDELKAISNKSGRTLYN